MATSKRKNNLFVIAVLALFGGALSLYVLIRKHRIRISQNWSIGIIEGSSPFTMKSPGHIKNPVLSAKDVTDVPAKFVADPFMLCVKSTWYMFFEVFNSITARGEIGLASSKDGYKWSYKQIVLREPFHLSYPYIFEADGSYYMIPESYQAEAVRLYKADHFPYQWSHHSTLLRGNFADSSIFFYRNKWWLFTSSETNDFLNLFYSDRLTGPWIAHPSNPLLESDSKQSRPGGRVFRYEGDFYRSAQDDTPIYGSKLRVFKILELTETSYQEEEIKESPVIKASGHGWNKHGMHQMDPHQINENFWIAVVDGRTGNLILSFNR